MQYEKTINKILQRISKEVPIAEVGDILETQKTIYPDASIPREDKNIILNCTEVTPPLACSKSWKNMFLKEDNMLCQLFKDFNRGDILKVLEVKETKVVVENLSMDDEFRKPFEIDKLEITKKNFSLIRRKSIELIRSLESLEDN